MPVVTTQPTTMMMKITKTIIVIMLLHSYSGQGMYSSLYMISKVKNGKNKTLLCCHFTKERISFISTLKTRKWRLNSPIVPNKQIVDLGSIPGSARSLEKEMATHSSILAWRIPWTEEPGRLQSTGSQRVGHD